MTTSVRDHVRAAWWLPVFAVVATAALFLVVKDSLTDDAYITLAYAKNLAVHGEWGLIAGEHANSATSPLNILLLALATLLTRIFGDPHPVIALGLVTVAAGAVIGWAWMRLVAALRLPSFAGVLGILVVLLNPFVLSAVGLEVLLIPAALILLTLFAVEGRPVWFGAIAGLAVMIRLDLVVFVLILAFSAAAIRRKLVKAVLSAVAVAGPWYLFSWIAFGSAVPDTLVIKQLQGGLFGEWSFFTGPVMYFTGRKIVTAVAFAPALAGLFVLVSWFMVRFAVRWEKVEGGREGHKEIVKIGPLAALGAGGVVYYGVYTLMGVGPYHWYFVAPIVSLSMSGVAILAFWLARSREQERLESRPPALALGLVGLALLGNIAVVAKPGVPWESPLIFGNWASAPDYARVGKALGERLGGATVSSPGEIGTLAYYCDCKIVDEFSDRGRVVDKVEKRIAEANPITSFALRVNYFFFDRSIKPEPIQYELRYASGPAVGPDSWTVHSAAKGVGHFSLVPAGRP
ncbi:hypothetical protein ACPZ19_37000 [Amycolatopsis lurida]